MNPDPEYYAILRATPGGKVDQIATEVFEERKRNSKIRAEMATTLGAIGTWGNDNVVTALLFKTEPLPVGWRVSAKHSTSDGIVGIPNLKTPEGKKFRDDLNCFPRLPGGDDFTDRIGGSRVFVGSYMRRCYFERFILGDLFVFSPYSYAEEKDAMDGAELNEKNRKFFTPEGCEVVKTSEYFRAREAAEEAAKTKEPT